MPNRLDQELRRSVTLPRLVLYGLGTMIGGGFYALLGKVMGEAGMGTPLAILVAGGLALVSAASFAELASRLPQSAGEAAYVQEAFGRRRLSAAVGGLVAVTGLVSAATLADAVGIFVASELPLAQPLVVATTLVLLGTIAAWGIAGTVGFAIAVTLVEVGGLVYVFLVSADALAGLPARLGSLMPSLAVGSWQGIGLGAFLVFYAFIGFEDMVNLAEEVEEPRRNLPRAILLSLTLTMLLYAMVALSLVLAMPVAELAASDTPLALAVEESHPLAPSAMNFVGVLAGVNGALVQIVMAARVAYGMGRRGLAPGWLGTVASRTRTPVRATLLVTSSALVLALWLPLATLARATSAIILIIFALVNLALWRIKRDEGAPPPAWSVPRWMPMLSFVCCLLLLGLELAVG